MNAQDKYGTGFVAATLRAALLLALVAAGWSIYRGLPRDESPPLGDSRRVAETRLHLVVRGARDNDAGAAHEPAAFQLYSFDVAAAQRAAQREFLSEPSRGARLEEFVRRRMGGRAPVEGRFDERGRAVVKVPPGKWWVHATLPGTPELTWRLPVNVAGREQSVELTPENAYTRAKRF